MQFQLNGVTINDTPKFLTNELTPRSHAIVINIKDPDVDNYNLVLSLILMDVFSYLPVHKPNKE